MCIHPLGEDWLFGVSSGRAWVKTPMVRVLANASLLRAFQPQSGESIHSGYSGLRPIYATQTSADIPVVGDEIKTGLVVAVKTRRLFAKVNET